MEDDNEHERNLQLFDFITKFPPDLVQLILGSLDNKTLLEACSNNAQIFRICLSNKSLREKLKFYLRIKNSITGRPGYNVDVNTKKRNGGGILRVRHTKFHHPHQALLEADKTMVMSGNVARYFQQRKEGKPISSRSKKAMYYNSPASTQRSSKASMIVRNTPKIGGVQTPCSTSRYRSSGLCKFPIICPTKTGVHMLRGIISSR